MGVVYGSQSQSFSPEIMRFHLQHGDGHVHQHHLNLQQQYQDGLLQPESARLSKKKGGEYMGILHMGIHEDWWTDGFD